MDIQSASKPKHKTHSFESADGTTYHWSEYQETAFTLQENELSDLRDYISNTSDEIILNDTSGNGIPMGVQIPLSEERLNKFLEFVLFVIKAKEKLSITLSGHAEQRLQEDILNGEDHPDFRGWLSEDDVRDCVCSIHRIDGARLTIDRRTLDKEEKRFNSPLALEVRGKHKDGVREGTIALAIIEETRIVIITLLGSNVPEEK